MHFYYSVPRFIVTSVAQAVLPGERAVVALEAGNVLLQIVGAPAQAQGVAVVDCGVALADGMGVAGGFGLGIGGVGGG